MITDEGYKPFIISTIVDSIDGNDPAAGYKPFIISTIVDEQCPR